jgi:hypothetical protein
MGPRCALAVSTFDEKDEELIDYPECVRSKVRLASWPRSVEASCYGGINVDDEGSSSLHDDDEK